MLDDVAREMQMPGGACYRPMRSLFGEDAVLPDGTFDRGKLAKIMFSDPELIRKVNGLVHPLVKEYVLEQVETILRSDDSWCVIEAALLLEDHYDKICDEIWYVYTDDRVRRERLKASRRYSDEKIDQIFNSQRSEEYFRSHCQYTIDNSADDMSIVREQIDRGLAERGFPVISERFLPDQ